MRIFYILLLSFALTEEAWPQGQIGFWNHVLQYGIDAPVFDSDCQTRLEGDAYLWQVYAGLTPDSLSPVGRIFPFGTGTNAGYMGGPAIITVPGAGELQPVYAQLRAWEAAAGGTYEAAKESGGKYGFSNIVPMIAREPPAGPPDHPVGLQSFCLIPEPAPWLLLGWAGGGALLCRGLSSRIQPQGHGGSRNRR